MLLILICSLYQSFTVGAGEVVIFPGALRGPWLPGAEAQEFTQRFYKYVRSRGETWRVPRYGTPTSRVRLAYRNLLFRLDLGQAARLREFMLLAYPEASATGEVDDCADPLRYAQTSVGQGQKHGAPARTPVRLAHTFSERERRLRRAYHVVEAVLAPGQLPVWKSLLREIFGGET